MGRIVRYENGERKQWPAECERCGRTKDWDGKRWACLHWDCLGIRGQRGTKATP